LIEVWNEPYRFDRADGYDSIWMNDMNELVTTETANTNIILIPCAKVKTKLQVLNKGTEFLKTNPTFYLTFMPMKNGY
jgi:mannan endo-1,4-beta-mannosidase